MALAIAALDRTSGIGSGLRLSHDLAEAEARIEQTRRELDRLREQADGLEADPAAQERAIREDLGLAKPGETVVLWPSDDGLTLRNH